jgi:hypothetical protein
MRLIRYFFFFLVFSASLAFSQFDTAGMQTNTWINVLPGSGTLPINGSNWAYENDLGAFPLYGFFIMGPGHVVHPQDCYWYPFDPLTNKWSVIKSPNKHPRS